MAIPTTIPTTMKYERQGVKRTLAEANACASALRGGGLYNPTEVTVIRNATTKGGIPIGDLYLVWGVRLFPNERVINGVTYSYHSNFATRDEAEAVGKKLMGRKTAVTPFAKRFILWVS